MSAPKKFIDEVVTSSGQTVRYINIPIPKAMPPSIKKALEKKVKDDIEEWKKQFRKSRFEMMQQSPSKVNKEKVAMKSRVLKKVAMKSRSLKKVARKPSADLPAPTNFRDTVDV